MRGKGGEPPLDEVIAAIAKRQWGLITRTQLLGLGTGAHGIAERVRSKRLHRLHRGVYAVGHLALRREAYWLAAVLACGPGAVLSHRSAAALWELAGDSATGVDVVVPTQAGRRRRPGIRLHRSGRLADEEVEREQAAVAPAPRDPRH